MDPPSLMSFRHVSAIIKKKKKKMKKILCKDGRPCSVHFIIIIGLGRRVHLGTRLSTWPPSEKPRNIYIFFIHLALNVGHALPTSL
jgi:hypothetical protein